MSRKPIAARIVLGLIAGGLVLPIAIAMILALAVLLAAMGDTMGGLVLRYVALGLGIAWAVVLVCMTLAQAVNSLAEREEEQ